MHWGFVIAGYLIVFTALAAYIVSVLFRGRELSKRVPEDRRRYLDSEAAEDFTFGRGSAGGGPTVERDSGVAP